MSSSLMRSIAVHPATITDEAVLIHPPIAQRTEKISVILPVFNESVYIGQTFQSVLEFAKKYPAYTFIFVNDGSTDDTKSFLLQQIEAAKTEQIKLVSYDRNRGKGYAVYKGVQYAEGELICFMDSDLAYSLEHLEVLVQKLQEVDVAIGCRTLAIDSIKKVKLVRKISGKVFNLLSRKILDLQLSDMQAGLKGFKKSVAKEIFGQQTICGFSFDVEIIYLAKKRGYSIGEIPAKVSSEHLKKISKINLLEDSLKMFLSLLMIKRNDKNGRYG